MKIYDGGSDIDNQLEFNHISSLALSTGNQLFILYKRNDNVAGKGFSASFTFGKDKVSVSLWYRAFFLQVRQVGTNVIHISYLRCGILLCSSGFWLVNQEIRRVHCYFTLRVLGKMLHLVVESPTTFGPFKKQTW